MTAYCSADDVLAAMPASTRPDPDADPDTEDAAKIARITSLCTSTAEMIDAEIKADFHRHPPAADPDPAPITWVVSGRGSRTLHLHAGAYSVTKVEVRYSVNDAWTEVPDADWESYSMFEAEDPERPLDHIAFASRLPTFPMGVRLTGVRGWNEPPARLVEMNVAWIRQHLAAGDSYSGAVQMPDGYIPTPRLTLPDDVRLFLAAEMRRYAECFT